MQDTKSNDDDLRNATEHKERAQPGILPGNNGETGERVVEAGDYYFVLKQKGRGARKRPRIASGLTHSGNGPGFR